MKKSRWQLLDKLLTGSRAKLPPKKKKAEEE